MEAEYMGFISVDKNAVFGVAREYLGRVIGWEYKELKDEVSPDQFSIGETYNIEELVK